MEDKTLVVSTSKAHGRGKGKSLLRKLEDNSIPVLSTITCWPRDEFHFHKNGKIDHVQKETSQNEYLNHEAWNEGHILRVKIF